MRKAEEYYVEMVKHSAFNDFGKFQKDVLNAIKQAQIEAIDETVKMCSKNATVKSEYKANVKGGRYKEWEDGDYIELFDTTQRYSVDKKSILQVADKLKKELE